MNIFNRIYINLQFRKKNFLSVPLYVKDRKKLGINRALKPYINFPIWVTLVGGAKVYLGTDAVDEYILEDLCADKIGRYFPDYLHLQAGDVVLDVGAHHGLYAVVMASRFKGIKVICVEPDPTGVEMIKRHIKKNSAQVQIVPYAIGSMEKDAFLTDNQDGSWGKTVEQTPNERALIVKQKLLKNVLGKYDQEKIRLIKSNCEGGEFDLIPQVIELGLKPELIILMIHPDRGDARSLVDSLVNYGYEPKMIWKSEINPCWHFIRK